jgi:hypothetical protein
MEAYNIVTYTETFFEEWDKFVETSVNGTIYQTRRFLCYHDKKKFEDTSILIYKKKELVCVLPCCKNGDKYFSHKGATYGGPAFSEKVYNVLDLNDIITLIFQHYNNNIEFRIANAIYNSNNNDILLYFLGRNLCIYPELAWYIDVNYDIVENIKNNRNKQILRKMLTDEKIECRKFEDDADYIDFYNMLSKNLYDKHKTCPTHTMYEFINFKNILLKEQALYLLKKNGTLYGGVYVIKTNKKCWYTFYIAKNYDIKNNMSIVYLMKQIQSDAKNEKVYYVDYGITTENCGETLNIGLSEFKEFTLGGKSSCRYTILKKK